MDIYAWILTLAIVAGQLIKLPLLPAGGATMLDIVVILFCLVGFFKLKFKFKKPPQFLLAVFAFVVIATMSLILSPLHLSLVQTLTSFLYTIRFSVYFLLAWEIYSGVFPGLKKTVSKILIFSGVALALLGLLQLIFIPDLRFLTKDGWDPHYFRTVSTFLDPNFLGGYFTLTLILLIQNFNKLKWSVFLFSFVYIGLLTSFSRGTYLAFFVSFTVLSILNKSLKLGILTLIFTFGLFFGYSHYQKSIAGPRNIDRTKSAEFRLSTWEQGLTLFQINPVLGVGYNAYRYGLSSYHLANEDFLKTHGSSSNDSSILFVASTTGVIGLTSYLLFLAILIKTGWKSFLEKNKWGLVLIAAIFGSLAQSFFANTLFYPFILVWFSLVSITL